MQLRDAALQLRQRHAEFLGDGGRLLLLVRQELVQRRIEQADGHRQSGHDLEQRLEVGALHGQHLGERLAAAGLVVGADHLAHGEDAAFLEEHVLGAAEPDALGAELAGLARLARRVGVGAHAQRPRLVGPAHDGGEVARQLRLAHLHPALEHLALAAVDGDDVALPEHLAADRHGAGLVRRCAACRRRTRTAAPCRAPPRRRGSSCRRAR